MKSPRRILFQAHWIVGITVGIVLAIVGVTGALLSFEAEIIELAGSAARRGESAAVAPLAAPDLLDRIAASDPDRRVIALNVVRSPSHMVRVTFAPPAGNNVEAGRGRGEQRFVNPYTGALLAAGSRDTEAFFRNVRQLHRWLMVGELGNRDIGRQVVGASTLLLIFMALTGLYLRWPRGRAARSVRDWLVPNFRLNGRAFLWNLHSVIGTWVLPIYLIIALTGLQWSYEWYRNGLHAIAGVERPTGGPENARSGAPSTERNGPASVDLAHAWQTFERMTDAKFSSVNINLAARAGRPIEFRYLDVQPNHDRAFNTLAVDAQGRMVRHERYDDKKLGARLVSSIFPLHSGSYFGAAGVVLFLLASLAMPLFALTGWIMYVQRRASRLRRTTIAAAQGERAGTETA